jgi:hypothetical protein
MPVEISIQINSFAVVVVFRIPFSIPISIFTPKSILDKSN